MSGEPQSEELRAFETALAGLQPQGPQAARDRLMYLAGRASVGAAIRPRRSVAARWLWPCATAVSLLAAATLGGYARHLRGRPQVVERVVYAWAAPATPADTAVASRAAWQGDYFKLRARVLRDGTDVLPSVSSAEGRAAPQFDIRRNLDELLGG
jgi:hypothetical protein